MADFPFLPRGPAEESFAPGADGTRIHYSVWNPPKPAAGAAPDAPPPHTLVLCDGIGCDGYAWKYLIRHFQRTCRIIHWQYRGHGKSGLPQDRTRTTFDDICSDLAAVLHATKTTRAVMVGHSMGVQVCLEYHRRHPEQVSALVLMLGSHGMPLDTFHDSKILRRVIPAMLQAAREFPEAMGVIWRLLSGGELAYQLATRTEVNGLLIRREDFMPYFDHLAGMDPRLFLTMLLNAGDHSAFDHLRDIDVPTLIVAGTADTFTPYWLSEEMNDRIPNSEMLTIPGGTHAATIEQPELIELRLERFLARLPKGAEKKAHAEEKAAAQALEEKAAAHAPEEKAPAGEKAKLHSVAG
jgi:pimeloyl-ACP methyl ester carboxylesterase